MRVLVTGGAGYIGSHTVKALSRSGHQPVILDNLVYGHEDLVRDVLSVPLVQGQVGDRQLLDLVLQGRHPELLGTVHEGKPVEAVLHFAAYAYVGESVENPAKYYRNNLGDSLTLLEALIAGERPIPIVFSSTCATYGTPLQIPIGEEHPQQPVNPYGQSKLMVEHLLRDFARAYHLPSVIFRYFNAAGADPHGDLGEDHDPETHLIPRVLDVILGKDALIHIFGDDYSTPDGTCIRDYIHVSDLADAHVLGMNRLVALSASNPTLVEPLIYNLGTGTGYSVKEVVEVASTVTGCAPKTICVARRPGDPAQLVACADKAREDLGWKPRYADLASIIGHAWTWHKSRHAR